MKLNKTTFFDYARNLPFGGKLAQEQVDGVNSIITAFTALGGTDARKLAYILATAFHETGGRMVPVREGFASTDAQARRIVANLCKGRPPSSDYSKPDPVTGHVYYGRGHVQLTWADNYKRMGKILGIPLYEHPDLALDKDHSAMILVEGMMNGTSGAGDFTGQSLESYFNDTINDPVTARRVVNRMDKAPLIAKYHHAFLDALHHAQAAKPPADVTPEGAQADKPNLLTDKTTLGTISAVASSGIFGMFSAINSPYALGALVVLIIAAGVFWYGRQRIINKAGV